MTLIDYEIALSLADENISEMVLAPIVYPPRFKTTSSDKRLPMTALNFTAISKLFALPKQPPEIFAANMARVGLHSSLSKLRNYFQPSIKPEEYKNRFCIKDRGERTKVYVGIGERAFMTGIVLKGARDGIIESVLDESYKEIAKGEPDPTLGPWNAPDRLFKIAVKRPKTGFKIPEMTVNALLVDSSELNARWLPGNKTIKVRCELGNIAHPAMKSLPFLNKNSRMILRHVGGMIHLRNRPGTPFLSGSLRNDQPIVRRMVYDKTYVRGGGDYFPPYMPAGFSVISWTDEAVSETEFKSL
jgi:hypothetical protein